MPDNPEMSLLKVEETVMECLEDSVVQLGNLQGSKYVQNNPSFLDIVNGWQRKIGNVDSALSTWKEVQQKWNALQSIFIGSADIRIQLPEDSKVGLARCTPACVHYTHPLLPISLPRHLHLHLARHLLLHDARARQRHALTRTRLAASALTASTPTLATS